MYRYDSSFAFPVKGNSGAVTNVRAYDVELLIRNASDGKKYLYDIVGIKENTTAMIDLQQRETRLAAHKAAPRGGISKDIVEQNAEKVNAEIDSDVKYTQQTADTTNQTASAEDTGAKDNTHEQYSLKGQDDLMKKYEKLREVNEGLKEQLKTTTFTKVDKKSLDAFTRKLFKDYSGGADIDDTRAALDDLYTYIANGEDGNPPAWIEVYKRAYETAAGILENAGVIDDEMYQSYKDLRDELRTRGLTLDKQYADDLIGYESISDFRKSYTGRIKIVNDGTPVNEMYAELAQRYPGFFDESEHSNPADQLLRIAEVLDGMQPMEHNPYSYNMREAATCCWCH